LRELMHLRAVQARGHVHDLEQRMEALEDDREELKSFIEEALPEIDAAYLVNTGEELLVKLKATSLRARSLVQERDALIQDKGKLVGRLARSIPFLEELARLKGSWGLQHHLSLVRLAIGTHPSGVIPGAGEPLPENPS
jgi:hypothetical protein